MVICMSNNSINYIKEKIGNNFDAKFREINSALGKIYIIFIDDLCDSKFISEYIVSPLIQNKIYLDVENIKEEVLYANIIGDVWTNEDALKHILSGDVVIVFDFWDSMIFCEAKNYPKRAISDAKREKAIKGPHEAFNEILVDNIGLIRKRAKNENLIFESIVLGEKSNTSVVVGYIKGVASDKLVNDIKNTVSNMENEFILGTNSIEEVLKEKNSLFDTIGFTERPDAAASKLFEGRVILLTEGTPEVIIAPSFFIEALMASEDYYSNKIFSNIIRIQRWIAFFMATLLPGIYIAITTYHFSLMPSVFVFRFSISRAGVPFPTVIELILMIFFFQLLREAGIRLPEPTGQTMSIVGALILGDAAVGAGLASRATIVIVSVASIATFLVPNLYRPISVWSLIIILFASMLGLPGFYLGFFVLVAHLSSIESCGYPYLYPLGSIKSLKYRDVILRSDLNKISKDLFNEDDKK